MTPVNARTWVHEFHPPFVGQIHAVQAMQQYSLEVIRSISLDKFTEALLNRANPEDGNGPTFPRGRRRPLAGHAWRQSNGVHTAATEVRVGPYRT